MMPRCDIFCCVIDNLGDAGIAVRLARALSHQHGFHVRLYIDDPVSLQKLAPGGLGEMVDVLPLTPPSSHAFAWVPPSPGGRGVIPADVVIELLGAEIPDDYIAGMQTRAGGPPVWIRYDYLSAEDWVHDAHLKSSPHPATGLARTFFYPGLTDQTGGILFSDTLGVSPATLPSFPARIFMFSYDQPAVRDLAELWAGGDDPVALDLSAGAYLTDRPVSAGSLIVREVLFLPQGDFDAQIGTYDLAFVRGEDSFSQAIAAGVPIIWQIYPTEDQAHLVKLQAFCDRFTASLGPGAARAFTDMQMVWNGAVGRHPRDLSTEAHRAQVEGGDPAIIKESWLNFVAHFAEISARAREFGAEIRARHSAAQNLVDFYYKSR